MAVQTYIAEDIADFIRKQSETHGVPFESELDAVLRRAMAVDEATPPNAKEPFTYEPFSSGFLPGVDVENPRRYADDLEIEELAHKMGIRDRS